MPLWRGQAGAGEEISGAIVVEPALAWFEADDHRMTRLFVMFRGVVRR